MAKLALEQITQDKSIQQRAGGLQSARVREYSKAMKNGDTFPPVIVYHDSDEDKYWLADGFHRCAAVVDAGFSEIDVNVIEGTRRDALLYAAGANAAHGVRRTNADKRKAVITLLTDEEWHQWSDHEIAKKTHTTQPFVSKLRRMTDSNALRLGADGRIIDTSKIGKSKPKPLENLWEKTSEEERYQWVEEHREEIQALLRRKRSRSNGMQKASPS
jgi:ParB-like chromosome segregation protein Spo0J